MTTTDDQSHLHHVVFAIAPERHDEVARLFTELGFSMESVELTELGLRVNLDWNRGIELMSPLPESTATVAGFVNEFIDKNGDGVYTVVIRVPGASSAEAIAERYGAITRFQQSLEGDGSYLHEVDLSVLGLPLTFLSTNLQ